MLSVDIKIDGITVGMIHAVDKGRSPDDNRATIYKFEYWTPGVVIARGTLLHVRSEGVGVLVSKILAASTIGD